LRGSKEGHWGEQADTYSAEPAQFTKSHLYMITIAGAEWVRGAGASKKALRAEATARGVSVEVIFTEAFKMYETQQKRAQIRSALIPLNDRSGEIAWKVRSDSRYCGEWVALEGNEVIAHGKDGRVVSACARSKPLPHLSSFS